jgi:tRNA threonylcarbamoyladenosine biosynthesis protein TsaB
MQNLLAIETSTETCSIALLHEGKLLQREVTGTKMHAESILVFVDALLNEAGISKRALDAVAFGQGPGAFTGVRLAVAVTQGLSFALDIPAIGVSTLKATAWAAYQSDPSLANKCVWAILDARMGEVYAAKFQLHTQSGLIKTMSPELVVKPDLLTIHPASEIAVGSGAIAYGDRFNASLTHILGPSAAAIAELASQEPKLKAADAMPVYLRNQVALTIKEREAAAAQKAMAI